MTRLRVEAQQAADFIRSRWSVKPRMGVILGTGYGAMAERVKRPTLLPYAEIPHFPRSTALAHVGRLVCGEWFGQPVVVMQGRSHLYEGYGIDQVALPAAALCELGVERLIVTNAAGGVNPYHTMGDVMLISSHINLLWAEPRLECESTAGEGAVNAVARGAGRQPYCASLLEQVWRASRTATFEPHRGVYLAVTGPSYETRAEYRCFRRLGADAVGMSTVPEALVAAHYGCEVLGVSVITNVARPDSPDTVDAEDVVAASQSAAPNVLRVVQAAIQ